jgi:hypothetical protein
VEKDTRLRVGMKIARGTSVVGSSPVVVAKALNTTIEGILPPWYRESLFLLP